MGSNKNSLISVITSCHKSNPSYLRESILSILNQTYDNFELLVANNGVDFNLEDFLTSFKDPRIKYIDNGGNIGPTASYDNLARIAKGKYIALQDHDDISLPHRLQVEKEALDKNPKIKSVSGRVHIFGTRREKDDGAGMDQKQVKEELIFWQPIKQPTFMKRKSFCKKYQYNPAWMIYDYEFWSRTRKEPHLILDTVMLKYCKSALNTGKDRSRNIRKEHALIVQRNLAALGISASIELCRALDPYNHERVTLDTLLEFKEHTPKLLRHISEDLYDRKLKELLSKTNP